MIKQLTSIPTYANDIGPLNYLNMRLKIKLDFRSVERNNEELSLHESYEYCFRKLLVL